MTGHDHAGVAERAPVAAGGIPLDDGDLVAALAQKERGTQPDGAGAADQDMLHAPLSERGGRIPQRKGSFGSRRNVASAVTCAEPVMNGAISPVRRSHQRYRAENTLPITLSCTQTSPSASFPSAARQASLALVPVPHGDRSYALPGHSTKLRLFAPLAAEGTNISTWSTSGYPAALTAWRTRQVKSVSASTFCRSMRSSWRSTRKNQFPPQATSPRTSPTPGTWTATCLCLRKLVTLETVTC